MFLRYIITTTQREEALSIINDTLKLLENDIISVSYETIKPYWKFDDAYEVDLNLYIKYNKSSFQLFLNNIADCWLNYENDILASESSGVCHIHNKKLEFLNICFDDKELEIKFELAKYIKLIK